MSVGNDVLDLGHPRCGDRPKGDRLLRRILAPGEREWLEGGGHAELRPVRLWTLWAAKEAAFKVLCKLGRGRRIFQPSALPCDLLVHCGESALDIHPVTSGLDGLLRIEGSVRGERPDEQIRIEGTSDGTFVHVVGWIPEAPGLARARLEVGLERITVEDAAPLERLRDEFTEAEWDGIRSIPSAWVRLKARARLEFQLKRSTNGPAPTGPPGRVEILTRRVGPRGSLPRVRIGGIERPELSLSLSHHGRYVAWAIRFGAAQDGTERTDRIA